ncbi:MAG: septum formation protein Maf [Chloroflexi bacterium]|nr:septum formation protein Maf [Chloroflexota bacterium]|tara:strand:+ start:24374 stop:24997 length:624 start_codon:yes stop_codon:yes gene_type:complete
MKEKINNKKIIFASSSPRRKKIIQNYRYDFLFKNPKFIEGVKTNKSAKHFTQYNATEKAISVSKIFPQNYVISADTVLDYKGKVIGKPLNKLDALHTLKLLNGDYHEVITSLAIVKDNELITSANKITLVKTYKISLDKIKQYLLTDYYKDKAGSYGIQNNKFVFVKEFYGCYLNIVGLPICLLGEILTEIKFKKSIKFTLCNKEKL